MLHSQRSSFCILFSLFCPLLALLKKTMLCASLESSSLPFCLLFLCISLQCWLTRIWIACFLVPYSSGFISSYMFDGDHHHVNYSSYYYYHSIHTAMAYSSHSVSRHEHSARGSGGKACWYTDFWNLADNRHGRSGLRHHQRHNARRGPEGWAKASQRPPETGVLSLGTDDRVGLSLSKC